MTYNNYPVLIIFSSFFIIFNSIAIFHPNNGTIFGALFASFLGIIAWIDFITKIKTFKHLTKNGKKITVTPIRAEMNTRINSSYNGNYSYIKYLVCSYTNEFGEELELLTEQTFKNLGDWLEEHPNTQLYGYIDPNDNTKYLIPLKQLDLTPYDKSNINNF